MGRSTLLALLVLSILGCSERREPEAEASRPAVFIISIDTLRSDRLPAYGYSKGDTPALDALRRDAILFEHAFSHCPQTLPAHASLFTGLLPPAHGVRDNIGYALRAEVPSFVTALRASGYATGAAVSSYVLRRAAGVDAGFDFYSDELEYQSALVKTSAERDGEAARQSLETWLGTVAGRPVFGFLHLYEPHAPYAAPEAYRTGRDPYDEEISYADSIVGRFLDTLKRKGIYDDALIIVLSDHGEGLGDHGELEHGLFLYRESIQVPLLVKLPRGSRAGQTVSRVVGLVDVAPTVLSAAGVSPAPALDGRTLLEDAPPEPRSMYSESYYSRLHFGWHELRSLVDERNHFIEAPAPELYRYREDPGETRNVVGERRREAFALRAELASREPRFEPPGTVDPEDQRKLAALGYIGSGGGAEGATRADPKEKLEAFQSLRRGFDLVLSERWSEAVPAMQELVRREPEMPDAWWLLAQSLRKTGKPDEAVDALEQAMRRFPTNANIALSLADLLFTSGRFDQAYEHAQLAARHDPLLAHELMARMQLKRERYEAAERHARASLAVSPSRTQSLVLLADVLRAQGRVREQIPLLTKAAREIESRSLAPIPGLHFQLGEALLADGAVRKAGNAFAMETKLFPGNRRAWASAALVAGAQGKRNEAREILRDGLRANPDREMLALAVEALEVMGDRDGLEVIRASHAQPQ